MSKKDLIRRLLDEGDNFQEDWNEDYSRSTLRRMRDPKDKSSGKPRREKPEWKKLNIKDDD